MPSGRDRVSIRAGPPFTFNVSFWPLLFPFPSVARTVKVPLSALMGIPSITPEPDRSRPSGRLPEVRLQV